MIRAGITMNMTTYLDLWDMDRTLEGRQKFIYLFSVSYLFLLIVGVRAMMDQY